MDRPFVDYAAAAERYDRGRAQSDEAVDRWWDAMRPHVPTRDPLVVLDLGSGTGLFSGAWVRWTGATVVAVEPCEDMRAHALARRPDGVGIAGGDGRRLPLRSGAVDVVWLSTVLHHLSPLGDALAEIDRVTTDHARVFVRGLVPGRSRVPWLDHFPGRERALERFPTETATTQALTAAGFDLVAATEVTDPGRHPHGAAADWVGMMRASDSVLVALTDDEIADGLRSLRRKPDELLPPLALTLLTYARRAAGPRPT